jgi:DNA invertase Pin-like site-specific DNA recombinase
LLGLQKSGVRFVAADMPEANEMIVGIMAVVAQAERKMISVRTKSALAAAKARGVKLGGVRHRKSDGAAVTLDAEAMAAGRAARSAQASNRASDMRPIIADIQATGANSLSKRRLVLFDEDKDSLIVGAGCSEMLSAAPRLRKL